MLKSHSCYQRKVMNKKILLITRNFKVKGGKRAEESFAATLLSTIPKYGNFDISILSIDDEIQSREEDLSFSITRILSTFVPKGRSASQFYTDFWLEGEKRSFIKSATQKNIDLARIIKEAKNRLSEVDVIHWLDAFSPLINLFMLLCKLYGIKNYVTQFSFFKHYPLNNFLLKASFYNFNRVVTTTASLASFFRTEVGLNSNKLKYIPLGVDLNLYKPPPNKGKSKKIKGIKEDYKVISWFGPIENCTFDDFRYLLISTQNIRKKIPSSIFFFCFKDVIPNCVYPPGDEVRFINNLSSIREILNITDLVVLPSTRKTWRIGLPLTIVEALASGVPVITMKNKGVNEAIIDGFNGILTERLEDIPKAIIDLCKQENKLIEMSQNSRIFAEKQFNIENVAQAYVNLWKTGK